MAADALALCVAKTSAALILTMWDKQVPIFLWGKYFNFHLSVVCHLTQCQKWQKVQKYFSIFHQQIIGLSRVNSLATGDVKDIIEFGTSTFAVPEQLSNGGGKNVGHSPAESGTDFWVLCDTTSATLWPLAKPLLNAGPWVLSLTVHGT